jgi:hypothetical protein
MSRNSAGGGGAKIGGFANSQFLPKCAAGEELGDAVRLGMDIDDLSYGRFDQRTGLYDE